MSIAAKIKTRDELVKLCAKWQEEGQQIGFSSGVFDLLHEGHVDYLAKAKEQCDVLIVAVNSDESTRALKGDKRPICSEEQRTCVLAALSSIDFVFVFSETNNNESVSLLKPNIYFKAGDYNKDKMTSAPIVESYGGKIVLLPFKDGTSSSSLIDTIAARYAEEQPVHIPKPQDKKAPAVFLDRDGTIIEHVEYLHEPEKVKFIPGALEGMKALKDAGFRIVIITQQPGIGLGYYTKEDFFRVNKVILKAASEQGCLIDKVYYSPYSKADKTSCRKPETALVNRAVKELNIDLAASFVVGDMTSDVQLAKNAGCKSVLVASGQGGQDGLYDVEADLQADDLPAAAKMILKYQAGSNERPVPIKTRAKAAPASDLEAIGEITGKLGHDFNNLFGAIHGCTELIEVRARKHFPEDNPFERQLKIMKSSVTKALILTSKLRGFVRPGPLVKTRVELQNCVKSLVELLSKTGISESDIELNVIANPTVEISEFSVVQMILSICVNALDAMETLEERCLVLHIDEVRLDDDSELELKAGNYARLSVVDCGVGISPEDQEKIFKPFYSTKNKGIGTGMGLSLPMAKEIMRKHDGTLAIASQPGVGTVVHLYFPIG